MRYYVTINGVSSLTIPGLAIRQLPSISKTLMRNQKETIDGRDGDIITELGYSAYDKVLEIGLFGTYDINQIIGFFNQKGTIVFSDEDDKYYNFTILDQIDYDKLVKFRTASVRIHCQPFKYPLTETPVLVQPESVSGEGTNITLDNTGEAVLGISLKGDTSQNGTPTPTSPIPIEVVTGRQEIQVGGKNYIDGKQTPSDIPSELTIIKNDDGSYTANGTISSTKYITIVDQYNLKIPVGNYVLSIKDSNGNTYRSDTYYYYGTTQNYQFKTYDDKTYTFEKEVNRFRVVLYISAGTYSNVKFYFQLEKGNQATTYTPHQEQNYEINLGDIELCKIGTYQDYIYKSGADWKIHREIGKFVLDGTNYAFTGFGANNRGTIQMSEAKAVAYSTQVSYLTHFTFENSVYYDSQNIVGYCSRNNTGGIFIRFGSASEVNTQTKANTWLSNNKPILYSVLATPTDETITDTELIEDLETLWTAYSYIDQTNITSSGSLPIYMRAVTLKKGTNEAVINNVGNIYAKPTIAIQGTGTIGLYLDNTQMLSIDMSAKHYITIDTEKMEAYNTNDPSELLNRKVTGDYSKIKLQPGNNTLKFTFETQMQSATITKWKRWL